MTCNCLIVIDMQNDFLKRLERRVREGLVSRTNELIRIFRRSGYPVIWITQVHRADLSDAPLAIRDHRIPVVVDGTPGAEIASRLSMHEQDSVVIKKRYSAFFETDLEQHLKDLAPKQVTLAGVNTHACIRTTAIDAYQRDMRVILASDCIESYDSEHARLSMAYMDNELAVALTNKQISARMR